MNSTEQTIKCTSCRCWAQPDDFKKETKRGFRILKSCIRCRDKAKKTREKNKCEHNRQKSHCKECGGASICKHNRRRNQCKDCDGASICIHKRMRCRCKECGGASICKHNRRRNQCKDCDGASICIHKRMRCHCKECGGASICKHNRQRIQCKICDPNGHLMMIVRSRTRKILKHNKSKQSIEYLKCSSQVLREWIEIQFEEGMTWDNYGEWHIDHRIPLKYDNPTLEEIIERLNYENLQPMWATDNISKGNRFIG
jgi:hypothetical protein